MKAVICDICHVVVVDTDFESKPRFKHGDNWFKLGLWRVVSKNTGVRTTKGDICEKCFMEKLTEIVKEGKEDG